MLVELRTYTFHPGQLAAFLEIYTSGPLDLQRTTLGNLLGYFVTECGVLNQVVHLWGYPDFEDRLQRRAALAANPAWQSFLGQILPMLQHQKSELMRPTAFSPTRTQTTAA